MKSVKIFTQLTAIFSVLVLPIFAFAQSPSLPHHFFGSVNFIDGAAPNGFSVEAKINGSVVGSSVTSSGNYGYDPNWFMAIDNDGVHAGKTVEFYVNGIKANETAIFVNGNSSQKNLTIPALTPTTPTPTPTPTSPSGSGESPSGGGGTSLATPKTGDINSDGKVDKYDFSLMMSEWGQTGSSLSGDLNKDGKVDKYDFALLMLNWDK